MSYIPHLVADQLRPPQDQRYPKVALIILNAGTIMLTGAAMSAGQIPNAVMLAWAPLFVNMITVARLR